MPAPTIGETVISWPTVSSRFVTAFIDDTRMTIIGLEFHSPSDDRFQQWPDSVQGFAQTRRWHLHSWGLGFLCANKFLDTLSRNKPLRVSLTLSHVEYSATMRLRSAEPKALRVERRDWNRLCDVGRQADFSPYDIVEDIALAVDLVGIGSLFMERLDN